MSNQGRTSALSAAIMAASLTMTGCIDSSSSDSEQSSESSRFQFTVTTPSDSNLAKSFIERSVESMVDFVIPKAHAALTEQNIQVAIVDASGKVLSIVTPKEAPVQEEDGSYSIVLEGGERLDCVILISLDGPNNVQVGETIDSEKYLFTPIVESEDIFDIDLTSTVAFGLFLDEVETFENLTANEVDRLIDGAQELVEETGITADSAEALEAALEEGLSSFIKTETALAVLSDETATEETPSTGSIESDREKIKGFFDDVNTLAALSNSFASAEEEGLLDDLVNKAEISQQVLEGSEQTLADFAELQSALHLELADFEVGDSIDLSEVFANDDKADLTGLVEVSTSESNVITSTFRINGSYGVLSSVNLEFVITLLDDTTPASVSLTGLLVSPEATIEVAEGLIELHTNEAFPTEAIVDGTLTPEQEAAIDNITLTSINTSLMISLSVHQEDENLSQFSGQMAFEIIRSTNDYIEFAGEEAQAYFNLKDINLEGRFSLGDDFVSAKVSAVQNNAESFVPMTQEHVEGEESTELLSYDYNGTDTFTLHTPDYSYTDTADANYAYKVLFVDHDVRPQTYDVSSESFDDYIASDTFYVYSSFGSYTWEGTSFTKGNLSGSIAAVKGANNDSVTSPETITIDYSYSEGTLSYTYISDESWGSLRGETLELLSNDNGVLNLSSTNIEAYPNYGTTSVSEYVANRSFDYYFYEDDKFLGYSINGDDLSMGMDQTVTATLYYSNLESASETLTIQYDLTDEYLEFSTETAQPRKTLFVKSEEYVGLNITRDFTSSFNFGFSSDEEVYLSYGSTKGTFQEYLERYSVSNEHIRLDSIGGVYVSPYELTIGADTALTTTINYVNSLENYENESTYSNLSVSAEFEVQLETLGNTKVSTQIERTGFDDGVAILTIENTDSTSLNSEITLMATVNDNQLGSLSIANGDGFVISKDALVDSGEAIELTYGLETAKVESVGTGIKVTYSNGEFDLY